MFERCTAFNQDISVWDVTNVQNMSFMFYTASSFNKPIGNWERATPGNTSTVGNVLDMSYLFAGRHAGGVISCSFNQDIGNWNTSSVTNMEAIFRRCTSFNQDISTWDVGNVANLQQAFMEAFFFNQNLEDWDISAIPTSIKLSECFRRTALNKTFSDTGGGTWFATCQALTGVANIIGFYENGDNYDGSASTATQFPKITA